MPEKTRTGGGAPSGKGRAMGGGRGRQTGLKATGKTARKRLKKQEKIRAQDSKRREAEAAVRAYEAGGDFGAGPKKRRKRRKDEDGAVEMDGAVDDGPRFIEMETTITVDELATKLDWAVNDVILQFMEQNVMVSKNQALPLETVRALLDPQEIEIRSIIPEEADIIEEEPDDSNKR